MVMTHTHMQKTSSKVSRFKTQTGNKWTDMNENITFRADAVGNHTDRLKDRHRATTYTASASHDKMGWFGVLGRHSGSLEIAPFVTAFHSDYAHF